MAYYDKRESSHSEKTPLLGHPSSAQQCDALQYAKHNAIMARKKRSATVNDAASQTNRLFPPGTTIASIPEIEEEPNQNPTVYERLRSMKIPKPVINSFLAVSTVVFMVVYIVVFPLYTGAFSAPDSGSDAYISILLVAVWFPFIFFAQVFFIRIFIDKRISLRPKASWANLFIAGFSMAINGILLALTSVPERTPPHLQSLLQTMLIPCTVIARYVILRKGVSRSQLVCLLCIFIGLFISLEPSIFQLDTADGTSTGATPWYYTVLFALAWLPAAVGYVIVEKGHNPEDDSLVYMAWVQVFLYSTYIFMVWVDFIPVLGMASSPQDFFHKLQRGFLCLYGGDPKCTDVPKTAIAFILSYSFANMSNLLLIRYAESAVYSVVVLALVTPISTIFWTLFSPTPSLHWNPVFNSNTIYLLVGLVIMMPSVVIYSNFSNTHAEEEARVETETKVKRRQRKKQKQKQKVLFNDDITVHDIENRTTIRRVCSAPSLMRVNE